MTQPTDAAGPTSAFAVEEDVTWDTGFGTEDTPTRKPPTQSPARESPAAPQATEQTAPVEPPVGLPTSPTPAEAQATEASEPPSLPVTPPVSVPSPTPSSAGLPVTPTQPAAPQAPAAEVAPAPAPVPAAEQPAPVLAPTPEPAWAPDPPLPTPVPAPASQTLLPGYTPVATPAVSLHEEVPEWASIRPDSDSAPAAFNTDNLDEVSLFPTPARPAAKARGWRPTGPKDTNKASTTTRLTRGGGARLQIKIFRGLVYSVLVILIVGGLRNEFAPQKPASIDSIAAQVQQKLGVTGFPTGKAESFAIRYATVYLNTNQASISSGTRDNALQQFQPNGAQWGWNNTGSESVIAGPTIASPTTSSDAHNGIVTVSAELSSGQWVALAIPVYADGSGNLVVSGPAGFVALPGVATAPGGPDVANVDENLNHQMTSVLPGFFTAWAASNTTALARYIAPGSATAAVREGLNGAVTLSSTGISSIVFPTGGATRIGTVEVEWNMHGSGSFTQAYTITITQATDGTWNIQDIRGGVVVAKDGSNAAGSVSGN